MSSAELAVLQAAKRLSKTWWKYRRFTGEVQRSDLFRDIASVDAAVAKLKKGKVRCAE